MTAFHAERNALATEVDADDAYLDMLMQTDDLCGVADIVVGELGDVDEAVLMDANIDEGSEVGDVGDDAWQNHAFAQVVDGLYAGVELELLNLFAGVAPRLLQLMHDIGEGRESYFVGDVSADVYLIARFLMVDEVADSAMLVFCHLFDDMIALRMNSRIVEWILGTRDAQETGTLLKGCWTEAGYLLQLCARGEGSVLFSVIDYVLRKYRT